MNTKHLPNVVFASLFCAVLSLTTVAIADDDEPGGDIEGMEQLHETIVLTATTNAPPGATAKAKLEAEDEDGTNTATLAVEAEGLLPSTYTVSVTKKSDGSTVPLGTFEVSSTNDEEDSAEHMSNDMMGDDDGEGDHDQGENENKTEIEFGSDEGVPLPADLNSMDIASVSISDSTGIVLLTGSFMDAADVKNGQFKAKVAITPGPATPNATGFALVQSKIKKGLRRTKFKLLAKGATPNEVLTLKINGVDVGTVTVDKHGRVRMKALPADVDPESLILIEFDEGDGTNAMSINF